jgi:hypothetical protein
MEVNVLGYGVTAVLLFLTRNEQDPRPAGGLIVIKGRHLDLYSVTLVVCHNISPCLHDQNAYVDIPAVSRLAFSMNTRDLINTLDRFYYRLYYKLQSQYRRIWSIGLRLINGYRQLGVFYLDSIDLYCATSDWDKAGEYEIRVLQSKDM